MFYGYFITDQVLLTAPYDRIKHVPFYSKVLKPIFCVRLHSQLVKEQNVDLMTQIFYLTEFKSYQSLIFLARLGNFKFVIFVFFIILLLSGYLKVSFK